MFLKMCEQAFNKFLRELIFKFFIPFFCDFGKILTDNIFFTLKILCTPLLFQV